VCADPDGGKVHLLDGMHSWQASVAVGFPLLPGEPQTRAYAEDFRGYPARQPPRT